MTLQRSDPFSTCISSCPLLLVRRRPFQGCRRHAFLLWSLRQRIQPMLSKSFRFYGVRCTLRDKISPLSTILQIKCASYKVEIDYQPPENAILLPFLAGRFGDFLRERWGVIHHQNVFPLSEALKVCAKMVFLSEGKQLHCRTIKLAPQPPLSQQNQLISLYIKSFCFSDAHQVFAEMPMRNVVSWNIIITGFVGYRSNVVLFVDGKMNGGGMSFAERGEWWALFFFREMVVEEMVYPNHVTLVGVFGACTKLGDVETGKQIHCYVVKSNFGFDAFVGSVLVEMYGKCSCICDAGLVFGEIRSRDLVLWNTMVSCYAQNGMARDALGTFGLMRMERQYGDGFTFSSLLNCCSTLSLLQLGRQIHACCLKLSLNLDMLVGSSLLDMYAKNGILVDARKAFDGMSVRNVVCWTTMIVGYGRNGEGVEALKIFMEMHREGLRPDELTIASILSSISNLAASNEAAQVHAFAVKSGLDVFLSVENALLIAYSKCGGLRDAVFVFHSIADPDIVSWTSMICAYSFHGSGKDAIFLFNRMVEEGIKPDRIAFLGVLSACSHIGRVDEGLYYFGLMQQNYQIIPDLEHYTCLVDLLGRAGRLVEAYQILVEMRLDSDVNVLGALLSACRVHKNIELGKWAAEKLFQLEPGRHVNYSLMSNIYATFGNWNEVAKVRKLMRNLCGKKVPGCSWGEIDGKIHTFISNDKSHPLAAELYRTLENLVSLIKEEQCFLSMKSEVMDVDESWEF